MKILFVTYNMPLPVVAGSNQRTALLIKALKRQHEVNLFLLRGPEQARFLQDNNYHVAGNANIPELSGTRKMLRRLFFHIRREYQRNDAVFLKLERVFRDGNYDLVIGRYLKPSEIAGVATLSPSIVDLDDLDLSVLANRLQDPGTPTWQKPLIKWKLRQLTEFFYKKINRYGRCWVASENDLPLLRRSGADVISNIAWQASPRPKYQPSGSKQILWVGSFTHKVNLDGMDRFIKRIWPNIFQAEKTASLCVVGSSLPEKNRREWSDIRGVKVLGFVENLDQVYRESAFSIVPLWDGAGTKIKVIESLSYGRTALVTSHAVRGYEKSLRHNEALWVAQSEKELIEGALRLLNDSVLRHKLEQGGREGVEQHHSLSSFYRQVDMAMENIQKGHCAV